MKYGLRKGTGDIAGLWLNLEEEFELDGFALRMMNHNDPVHLIPVSLVQRDGESCLQYDTKGMKPLSIRLSEMTAKKELLLLLGSAIEAFEEIENYMLSEDELLTGMEHVYVDQSGRCRFVCIPCKGQTEGAPLLFLRSLAERMLTQCGRAQADTFLYDLVNTFNGDGIRTLGDLKEFLRRAEDTAQPVESKRREQTAPEEVSSSVSQGDTRSEQKDGGFVLPQRSEIEKNKPLAFGKNFLKGAKPPKKEEENKAKPKAGFVPAFKIPGREDRGASYEERQEAVIEERPVVEKKVSVSVKPPIVQKEDDPDEMYESYEGTIMMTEEEAQQFGRDLLTKQESFTERGILTRKKTGEQLLLRRGETSIGSGKSAACMIDGNKAISRVHVLIRLEGGRASLQDNQSSNGTYVNGKRLLPGEIVELGEKAFIQLADEEFDFLLDRKPF